MEGQLGVITLNRPDRRNPLSLDLMLELTGCLDEFAASTHIRVIILAAAGKVFSSGHDLSEMVGRTVGDYRRLFDVCTELMAKIQSIPQPDARFPSEIFTDQCIVRVAPVDPLGRAQIVTSL